MCPAPPMSSQGLFLAISSLLPAMENWLLTLGVRPMFSRAIRRMDWKTRPSKNTATGTARSSKHSTANTTCSPAAGMKPAATIVGGVPLRSTRFPIRSPGLTWTRAYAGQTTRTVGGTMSPPLRCLTVVTPSSSAKLGLARYMFPNRFQCRDYGSSRRQV